MTSIVLVGNPNCGKTTLFNALTGQHQKVGNWPGVTVEKKTGSLIVNGQSIELTDLPGIYSLVTSPNTASQDEIIAAEALLSLNPSLIINVIDACHLERHLYLSSQLLELQKPMIIALNMMDIATQRGIIIDLEALSQQLGCPVIGLTAHQGQGVEILRQAILTASTCPIPLSLALKPETQSLIDGLQSMLHQEELSFYMAYRLAEGDHLIATVKNIPKTDVLTQPLDLDIELADARYTAIHQIVSDVQHKTTDASHHLTAMIDRVVLHRYVAIPLFFSIMYLMFLLAINVGGAFQDFFDLSTDAIFVQGSALLLTELHSPHWLTALIAYGVGKGINTTLTFIPVIASMYFLLAVLEASGYMARAAFVVDRAMRALGLPGKSFVPMIVGFGCNVPAIMAARTLDSERDRLLTVLMSPFMSCSARLAIYAVFVAAFFPTGGQNIVFSLYLIGILMAVFTGYILRKTTLKGQSAPLILELPAYHRPGLKRLLNDTGRRLQFFIKRAAKVIIPTCLILGGLNTLTLDGGLSHFEANSHSVLSMIGQALTPLFTPMGIHADNWPATVGLLSGMLAKEVVVGSLNSLYAQIGHLDLIPTTHHILDTLHQALLSIPANLSSLGEALMNPILASAPSDPLSDGVYGMMATRFDGKIGAFAYLLFILLYIPCVSTMAAIRQEASRKYMWFSVLWSGYIGYATAVLFYQIGTFTEHPSQSSLWILLIISSLALILYNAHHYEQRGNYAPANS